MATATIIGSGPNGLSAALVVASAGISTVVVERNEQIGGACSTAETTLPGFRHDLGSSVYPIGRASPFFRSLPVEIPWIEPMAPCAHPLDDGTAVLLEHSIADTAANLDAKDGQKYRSLIEPLAHRFSELIEDTLRPIQHIPQHPLLLARFGLSALTPAASLASSSFSGIRARALFAGMAAHSVMPLEASGSAAVALMLMSAGHACGWPIVRGGGQTLVDALAHHLESLGGRIEVNREMLHLPHTDITLADITPRQLLRIAASELPPAYRRQLAGFRYGGGTFKIDYALQLSDTLESDGVRARRHGASRRHTGGDHRIREEFHLGQALRFTCSTLTLRSDSRAKGPTYSLGVLSCSQRKLGGLSRSDRTSD